MKPAYLLLAGALLAPLPAQADGEKRIDRLASRLDLTETQTAALEELVSLTTRNSHDERLAMRSAQDALARAIHSEFFDEAAIRDAAAQVAAVEADRAVERARWIHGIRAILTPEQWKQYRSMQERRERGGRGMGGPHGRRGGRGGMGRH